MSLSNSTLHHHTPHLLRMGHSHKDLCAQRWTQNHSSRRSLQRSHCTTHSGRGQQASLNIDLGVFSPTGFQLPAAFSISLRRSKKKSRRRTSKPSSNSSSRSLDDRLTRIGARTFALLFPFCGNAVSANLPFKEKAPSSHENVPFPIPCPLQRPGGEHALVSNGARCFHTKPDRHTLVAAIDRCGSNTGQTGGRRSSQLSRGHGHVARRSCASRHPVDPSLCSNQRCWRRSGESSTTCVFLFVVACAQLIQTSAQP